jgi:hypothetical protein
MKQPAHVRADPSHGERELKSAVKPIGQMEGALPWKTGTISVAAIAVSRQQLLDSDPDRRLTAPGPWVSPGREGEGVIKEGADWPENPPATPQEPVTLQQPSCVQSAVLF